MASLQKTYSGDLSTSIARQLWVARNIAAAAKGEADQIIGPNVDDNMLRPGEFMSRALQMRATSRLPKRFQRQMPNLMGSDYLLRGQSRSFASPINPQFTNNQAGARAAGQPFPWLAVGAPLSAQRRPASPSVLSQAAKTSGAPTTTNTKTREKGVVVKDQKLGNFLAAVALSLSSSLNAITKKMDEANEGVIVAKDGIDLTYKKLEENSDSLESKLDAIISALRFANLTEEQKADRRESSAKQREQNMETDMSSANRILMQDMDQEEINAMQQEDKMDDDRGPITNTSTPTQNAQQLNLDVGDLPSAAEGGIMSGPDSGYLAVLHGDEAVIPLDNNFTQGQATATNRPVTPNMPMLERGTDNLGSMKPQMLPWGGMRRPAAVNGSINMGGIGGSELAAAIQLPAKAAGIVTMGLMGNAMKHGNLPPGVVAHMKSISAPIASTFGISDVMASDLAEKSEGEIASNQRRQNVLAADRGREGRERGVLGKIKDFLFGTGGGYRGVGGGGTSGKRTGYTGTGGGNIAWGKKKQKEITSKADFGSIKRRTATTDAYMVEAGMLDPSAFESKYGISADKWLRLPDYPTNQSSLDSPVFTKNVSYENAFDYKKFESPQYGLRTSDIAYNMSMEDELSSLEGISDASNPVVLNNQSSQKNANSQIEHSAIATRGNPLKEGTYLSPYSV